MARKPRLHVPGALYHVILRGNARQDIFFTPADRTACYELLAEGVRRFGYRVHAFCLMTNHMHLALQAGEESLSRGMQNLAFRHTRHVNAARKRVGHLFEGRYKAFLVDEDRYGLQLVRYIHLNPVRAGMTARVDDYPWSGHRAYLDQESLPWLTTEWVLGQFGSAAGIARRRYARFVADGAEEPHRDDLYGGDRDPRVVGEEDFIARTVPAEVQRPRPPTLAAIVALVCRDGELTPEQLVAPGRARKPARARTAAAWLALRTGAATLVELGALTGRDASTFSHGVTALEAAAERDPAVRAWLEELRYSVIQA
jgi:REP element-mobilizing transposase RayT